MNFEGKLLEGQLIVFFGFNVMDHFGLIKDIISTLVIASMVAMLALIVIFSRAEMCLQRTKLV